MTRLEKLYVRDEHCRFAEDRPSSKELSEAIVYAVNESLVHTWRTTLVGGFVESRPIRIQEFIQVKDGLHEFLRSVLVVISEEPMTIGYLIRAFFKKAGVLGVAYLRAALDAPRHVDDDSLVYEAELRFPDWESVSVSFIKLTGKLPTKGQKYRFDRCPGHPTVGYQKVAWHNIKNESAHIYWGGKPWTYSGKPLEK